MSATLIERLQDAANGIQAHEKASGADAGVLANGHPLVALLEEAIAALEPKPSALYLAWIERQKNCDHAAKTRVIVATGQVAVCPDCGDGLAENERRFAEQDNPETCPECGGKQYHHTTECYLGISRESV